MQNQVFSAPYKMGDRALQVDGNMSSKRPGHKVYEKAGLKY